jgi:hypothetical protein
MNKLLFFKLAKYVSLINVIIVLPSIAYNYFIVESILDTSVNLILSIFSLIVLLGFVAFGVEMKNKFFTYLMILSLCFQPLSYILGIFETPSSVYFFFMVLIYIIYIIFYSFLIYFSKRYKILKYLGIIGFISIILFFFPSESVNAFAVNIDTLYYAVFIIDVIISFSMVFLTFIFFSRLVKDKSKKDKIKKKKRF